MKTIVHGRVTHARYSLNAAVLDRPLKFQTANIVATPDDWTLVEVRDLKPFVTSGSRGWARFYSETGAPFLRITNLSRDSIYPNLEEIKFVRLPREASAEATRTQVREGDLLISITADIGVIGFVDSNLAAPAYINQHIALIRFSKEVVSSRFVAYYLASEGARRLFVAVTDVGAKTGLNLTTIRKLRLALPALPEQRAIAEALLDVDELLSALEALIAKKRAIKHGAMQQLLTGRTRLPGFSGEWEPKRLGDHLKFLRNGVNSRAELSNDGRVQYLHYGDIHTTTDVFLDAHLNSLPKLSTNRANGLDRLQDGDLVLVDASEDLDGVGKSVEINGVLGQQIVSGLHTIAVRFDKTVLADGYKAYLQFCPIFRQHLRRLAAGTKVYATNRAHIAGVEMLLPDTDEQIAIATVLSDMDAEIAALEARRDKTRAVKHGMMQQLLTGRIRLVKPQPAEAKA